MCPQSEIGLGFRDKNSRRDHESKCEYRVEESVASNELSQEVSNKEVSTFDDDLAIVSSDKQVLSVADWMNMELAKANFAISDEASVSGPISEECRSWRDMVDYLASDDENLMEVEISELSPTAELNRTQRDHQDLTSVWDLQFDYKEYEDSA